jgi:hypothetical protein
VDSVFSWHSRRPARGCQHISCAHLRSRLKFQAIDYSKDRDAESGYQFETRGSMPDFLQHSKEQEGTQTRTRVAFEDCKRSRWETRSSWAFLVSGWYACYHAGVGRNTYSLCRSLVLASVHLGTRDLP